MGRNDNLIQGPIGSQTINIVHNGPLAQLLLLYRNLWNEGLAPANAHTDNCSTWTPTLLPTRSAFSRGPMASTPPG